MSVYTTLNTRELTEFLQAYDVGRLTDFQGISEGIENTNYFVNTIVDGRAQHFVLTVFEGLGFDEVPYFLDLMAYLAEHGLPCAHPIAAREGGYLQTLKGKPAALVKRLEGRSIEHPGAAECRQVGAVMAHLHIEGRAFASHRANPRGLDWFDWASGQLQGKLSEEDRRLLDKELAFHHSLDTGGLPAGVIHADLFRDNVLFSDGQLTGVIDLYYACDGTFLYDLAVTCNDWCSETDGSLNRQTLQALLDGYRSVRPLTDAEWPLWSAMLRAGALRFWLSRLIDMHYPRPGDLTHIKDPELFRAILANRIAEHKQQERTWA
jgi:homoserine kinase type II